MAPRKDYLSTYGFGTTLGNRYERPQQQSGAMPSIEFTRTLTTRVNEQGKCHCGSSGLIWPERSREPNRMGQYPIIAYHCLQCRCDEHTPAAHALWTPAQRRDLYSESSTTMWPGCGRLCDRGAADVLLSGWEAEWRASLSDESKRVLAEGAARRAQS